jgi:prophage regulatory protein
MSAKLSQTIPNSVSPGDRVLRETEVLKITNRSRPSRWRDERAGSFPRRIQLGPNSVGWLESEIFAWLSARANERGT